MNFLFFNKNKSSSPYLWVGVSLCIFISILLLNILTPYIADDYGYMFYFGAGYPRYIHSLSDLIGSQYNHYNMWGGRVIGHGIAQVLLRLHPWVASFLNSVVYMLFSMLIYRHIVGKNKGSLLLYILVNLFIWFFIPSLGDTLLWITGSANYLWCTTIILAFLYLYRLDIDNRNGWIYKVFFFFLSLIGGIVAGCTNENTVAGLIVMLILLIFRYYVVNKAIPVWYITGFVSVCIGYLFLVLAPGNSQRASINLSVFILLKRFVEISAMLVMSYGWLLVLAIGLLFADKRFHTIKYLRLLLELPCIYVIGALISTYVMLASPQFPERSWFGIVVFFVIAIGILLENNKTLFHSLIPILRVACVIGVIGFLFSYLLALRDIDSVRKQIVERKQIAKQAIDNGDKVAYFKPIKPNSRFVHEEDDETNFLLSYYYKIFIEFEK